MKKKIAVFIFVLLIPFLTKGDDVFGFIPPSWNDFRDIGELAVSDAAEEANLELDEKELEDARYKAARAAKDAWQDANDDGRYGDADSDADKAAAEAAKNYMQDLITPKKVAASAQGPVTHRPDDVTASPGGPIVRDSLWPHPSSRRDLSSLPDFLFDHVAVSEVNPDPNDTTYGGHEGYLYDTAAQRWNLVSGFISRGTGPVIQIGISLDMSGRVVQAEYYPPVPLAPIQIDTFSNDFVTHPFDLLVRGFHTALNGDIITVTPPVIGILGFPDSEDFHFLTSLPVGINNNGVLSVAEIIVRVGTVNGHQVIYYDVLDFLTGTFLGPFSLKDRSIFDPNSPGPLHVDLDPFNVQQNVINPAEKEDFLRAGTDRAELEPGSVDVEPVTLHLLNGGMPSGISLKLRSNVNRPTLGRSEPQRQFVPEGLIIDP